MQKLVNSQILHTRKQIKSKQSQFEKNAQLTHHQWKLLLLQYSFYNNFDPNNKNDWQFLESNIDIVPTALVIAMALYNLRNIDSGNLQEYYEMFTKPCYSPNCGTPF